VKVPLTVVVRTAPGERVLMGAKRVHERSTSAGRRTQFEQPTPLSHDLIGIAIGPWVSKKVGRAVVWGIPSRGMNGMCKALQNITEDLERAEQLVGALPCPKTQYLHLPTARDFAVSIPELVLLSQTIDPYPDRKQLAVHELAHQWFGNHVTPARWCDVWLNEGLATFLERKLATSFGQHKVGRVRKTTAKRQILLRKMVRKLRRDGRRGDACLCCKVLDRKDPDEVLGARDGLVVYEKGYLLLCRLRQLVGETAVWSFLRPNLRKFGGKSASSQDFVELWQRAFPRVLVDWRRWLHRSAIPGDPKTS